MHLVGGMRDATKCLIIHRTAPHPKQRIIHPNMSVVLSLRHLF